LLPELVGEWDVVRLQRAFSNLLDNAIKYSPRGGEVVIAVEESSQDRSSHAKVTVTDQGIGIPEVDLPHVFDRFYRAGNVDRTTTGSGIGLAGVRQIVEQHGGLIEIHSVEGGGTTVTVMLPIA
jgi:signal transduction histidine kinase